MTHWMPYITVFKRPGSALWAVKRKHVPQWVLNRLFSVGVRHPFIGWFIWRHV